MSLKPKDIIIIIISLTIIIGSIYFVLGMTKSSNVKNNQNKEITEEKVREIPEKIDDKAVEQVEKLNDYGKPSLENIGRTDPDNPFAPIQ